MTGEIQQGISNGAVPSFGAPTQKQNEVFSCSKFWKLSRSEDEELETLLEHIKAACNRNAPVQLEYKTQGIGNGTGSKVVMCFDPRALAKDSLVMPCPKCESASSVMDLGFPENDWYREVRTCVFVIAKEFSCEMCKIQFRGWNPISVQLLKGNLSFEIPGKDECPWLYVTEPEIQALPPLNFSRSMTESSIQGFALPDSSMDMMEDLTFLDGLGDDDFFGSSQPQMDEMPANPTEALSSAQDPYNSTFNFDASKGIKEEPVLPPPMPPVLPKEPEKLTRSKPTVPENVSDLLTFPSDDSIIAASLKSSKRSIQFCSVCFGIRRQRGELVAGHRPDGYCPVNKRKATADEKRELRRRRQKMRRALNKQKKGNK